MEESDTECCKASKAENLYLIEYSLIFTYVYICLSYITTGNMMLAVGIINTAHCMNIREGKLFIYSHILVNKLSIVQWPNSSPLWR